MCMVVCILVFINIFFHLSKKDFVKDTRLKEMTDVYKF